MILARYFGARLRELREGKGLTQSEMGKPRTYVCDVEAGRRDVRFSTVEHFASVLRVHPAELFRVSVTPAEEGMSDARR